MPVQEYDVAIEGIGRVDYSNAVELTTEPVISSWQNVYSYYTTVTVPAAGFLDVIIPISSDLVCLVYDYFASIPSNRLIRLIVYDGASEVFNKAAYQTVTKHINRGKKFQGSILFRVYNYRTVAEPDMYLGAAGMFTTEEQYTLHISP